MSTIWEQVTAGAKLISLPDIYLRLRAVLDDPDFSMSDVSDVICRDPGMTARLLRLVNSAFFGLAAKIETVTRATSLLGTQQVHDLILATSVAETFDGMSSEVMDMHRFWRRSIHCGVLSRLLANKCNVLDSERLFVAGLLRDIGHLVMYQTIPDLSRQAMEQSAATSQPLFKIEREIIGLDYARVGGALMRQWDLPKSLTQAAEFHVEPGRAVENALETAIVHLAALVAESCDAGEAPDSWQARIDEAAWQLAGLSLAQCSECQIEADGQIEQVMQLIFPEQKRAVG
ncbi:MAG: HDOD domain-containing protein [Gammaproteobacteria bacterium]|nr:HDOD domain-containing protein [Gammaproteobacteria bacterium]